MSHTSTLTLLGQANESATKTASSLDEQLMGGPANNAAAISPDKVTKSQLNLLINDGSRNGLRIRGSSNGSAIVCASKTDESQVIADENNNVKKNEVPVEEPVVGEQNAETKDPDEKSSYRMWGVFPVNQPVKLLNSIMIPIYHLLFLYAMVNIPAETRAVTILWGFFMGGVAGFGVTGGVHRMWTHKAYKAKLPLRIILAICFSVSGQNTIFDWVRDHRVHHKYSETDADPHDSNRGFWFAHVGWLMMNKHPNVVRKGRQIDMSDILADPVVQFHEKYFVLLKLLFCFILPTAVPPMLWNESWYISFMSQAVIRYVFSLNFTWLVNSAAHIWGSRPYDKRINPAENIIVSMFAMGEGWHNYHHVFPWDYKAAELPYKFNVTTILIDLFAKIGWAYDLKEPSKDLVRRTIEKHGDGSYAGDNVNHHHHMPEVEYAEDLKQ